MWTRVSDKWLELATSVKRLMTLSQNTTKLDYIVDIHNKRCGKHLSNLWKHVPSI